MNDPAHPTVSLSLIRNARVLTPEEIGICNVFLIDARIAVLTKQKLQLPEQLQPAVEMDLEGDYLVPGFIDGHVHILGGGGEGGPCTRTPEITLTRLTTAGVTTVVGVLGTDGTTRSLPALLAKCRALRHEGLSVFVYTGAYQVPTPTLLSSVRQDIALLEPVIGAKTAISDHRSSQPTLEQLRHLASECRVGGMLGDKPGLLHLHVGSGAEGLSPVIQLAEETEIPAAQFYPTHVSRSETLLSEAAQLTRMGATVDVTAGGRAAEALQFLWKQEADPDRITLSSDANGSMPRFDEEGEFVGLGVASPETLLSTVADLHDAGVPLQKALAPVTINPARQLDMAQTKGRIAEGAEADMLCLSRDSLTLRHVWAKGQLMLRDGQPVKLGTFER